MVACTSTMYYYTIDLIFMLDYLICGWTVKHHWIYCKETHINVVCVYHLLPLVWRETFVLFNDLRFFFPSENSFISLNVVPCFVWPLFGLETYGILIFQLSTYYFLYGYLIWSKFCFSCSSWYLFQIILLRVATLTVPYQTGTFILYKCCKRCSLKKKNQMSFTSLFRVNVKQGT